MAKTTKSTKRTTTTAKKKSGLGKLNFNSRKTQFITVIVLVALMGAGWFTYRSFALSNANTIASANLDNTPVSENTGTSGKAGLRVAQLEPGQNLNTWVTNSNVMRKSKKYKVCGSFRTVGRTPSDVSVLVQQVKGLWRVGDGFTKGYNIRVASGNKYVGAPQYCTAAFQGWGGDALYVTVKNNGPSAVRSGSLILQEQ
jgi:hypothetical protein